MEQEFPVAFATQNWRLDRFEVCASELHERSLYFGNRRQLRRFVTDNSALAHRFPACFELRLHQHDDLAGTVMARIAYADTPRITAGSTSVAEINETSIAMKSTGSPMSLGCK